MKKVLVGVALVMIGAVTAGIAAESLVLVTSPKVEPGASRTALQDTLGEPSQKIGPVGYPAVERWEYSDGTMVVLLEDTVVDAFTVETQKQ